MVGKGRFFVGGNWKCNETTAEAKKLVEELNAGSVPDDIEIIVAPTYIHLQMVGAATYACNKRFFMRAQWCIQWSGLLSTYLRTSICFQCTVHDRAD